jgi:hypothetical protein
MPIITLTTDYGTTDYYVAALKGALYSRCKDVVLVDVSHHIEPHDIVRGAFVLQHAYPEFPEGTIHLVSVNFLPEKELTYLALRHEGHYFVGPDNGLFSLAFAKKPTEMYRLERPEWIGFPEKEILSDAAAYLSSGKPFHEIGYPVSSMQERMLLQPAVHPSQIMGSVLYIDHYGNVISNIDRALFEQVGNGRRPIVSFKRHDRVRTISRHYNEVPVGEPVCIFNASGLLEVAINMGDAAGLFDLRLDDLIQVDFH